MAIAKEKLFGILSKHFENAEIDLQDLVGDEDHYKVSIIWAGFAGLPLVKQHQEVYKALGDIAGKELHALSIETKVKG